MLQGSQRILNGWAAAPRIQKNIRGGRNFLQEMSIDIRLIMGWGGEIDGETDSV